MSPPSGSLVCKFELPFKLYLIREHVLSFVVVYIDPFLDFHFQIFLLQDKIFNCLSAHIIMIMTVGNETINPSGLLNLLLNIE